VEARLDAGEIEPTSNLTLTELFSNEGARGRPRRPKLLVRVQGVKKNMDARFLTCMCLFIRRYIMLTSSVADLLPTGLLFTSQDQYDLEPALFSER
jgi:hypothetical protein